MARPLTKLMGLMLAGAWRSHGVAMLFGLLAQSPVHACSIVAASEAIPCFATPRLPNAPAPTLQSILAQAKAESSAPHFSLRCQAAWLDGELGHSEERLFALLGGDDPVLRMLGAAAIAQHAEMSAHTIDGLLHLLADTNEAVVGPALEQVVRLTLTADAGAPRRLAWLSTAQKESLARALLKSGQVAADAKLRLALVFPPFTERLAAQLAWDTDVVRESAHAILEQLPPLPAAFMPGLCAAAQGDEAGVVAFAAGALARAGNACADGAWVRVLAMDRPSTPLCGGWGTDLPRSVEQSWQTARNALRALGEPGLHALLVAASAQERPGAGLLWALAGFPAPRMPAEDAAMMLDLIARFPAGDPAGQGGDDPATAWHWDLGGQVLEQTLERWLSSEGKLQHAALLGNFTPAQWRAADAHVSGNIGKQLLIASAGGEQEKLGAALELLGVLYFDRVPPAHVLDAIRAALAVPEYAVSTGGLVALTSIRLSGKAVRTMLRASALVKGSDLSALVLALGAKSDRVVSAAVVALGVLRAPDVTNALLEAARRSDASRMLVFQAIAQINGPSHDDRLPWTRHRRAGQ